MVSGKIKGVHCMTEHELQNQIRAALSEYGKVFRTNAGEFWQGKRVWSRELQAPVISDARKVEGLPYGFSDLLFLDSQGAAFIEVKPKRAGCLTGRKSSWRSCGRMAIGQV